MRFRRPVRFSGLPTAVGAPREHLAEILVGHCVIGEREGAQFTHLRSGAEKGPQRDARQQAALKWLTGGPTEDGEYELTDKGAAGFAALGVDLETTRTLRRRFAFACLDWSVHDLDSRALTVTVAGHPDPARTIRDQRFGISDSGSAIRD